MTTEGDMQSEIAALTSQKAALSAQAAALDAEKKLEIAPVLGRENVIARHPFLPFSRKRRVGV
jgi:hypothetical protein